MILPLFGLLIFVSLVLIVIGLARPNESYQALVGFLFLFLLSTTLLGGNLLYETGSNVTTSMTYSGSTLVSTDQEISYIYDNFNNSLSKQIGLYLAIASVIGFSGVLWSLKTARSNMEDV